MISDLLMPYKGIGKSQTSILLVYNVSVPILLVYQYVAQTNILIMVNIVVFVRLLLSYGHIYLYVSFMDQLMQLS